MDFGTGFYHCLVTATTVGYGDVAITTEAGRVLATCHILLSVCLLGAILSDIDTLRERRKLMNKRHKLMLRKLDSELITSLDLDGSGVDKFEFVLGMLHKLQMVQWEEVEPFVKQFEALDKDGNGRLNKRDLELLASEYKERGSITGVDTSAAARLAESVNASRRKQSLEVSSRKPSIVSMGRQVTRIVSAASCSMKREVTEEQQALGAS
eukprot:1560244-Prymnesium_polylepis.1